MTHPVRHVFRLQESGIFPTLPSQHRSCTANLGFWCITFLLRKYTKLALDFCFGRSMEQDLTIYEQGRSLCLQEVSQSSAGMKTFVCARNAHFFSSRPTTFTTPHMCFAIPLRFRKPTASRIGEREDLFGPARSTCLFICNIKTSTVNAPSSLRCGFFRSTMCPSL